MESFLDPILLSDKRWLYSLGRERAICWQPDRGGI